jgi:tyrosine-protein phosphatase YwqE
MFSFFHKKKPKRGPLLSVDLHSHLIPGIDDGAQSMEESIALLHALEALGYQKLITTPHIMSDYYKNSAQTILPKLEMLRKEALREGITLQIEAAAEYYLDEGFFEQMQKSDVMAIKGKYILFETSYISKPLQMEEMIFAIGEAGYQPILAHPERYRYIKDPMKEYGRLRDLGVLFQVNLNSFGGHYGGQAKQLAELLNDQGMIDFLGSDTHHIKQVKSLESIFYTEVYKSIFKHNTIKNDLFV